MAPTDRSRATPPTRQCPASASSSSDVLQARASHGHHSSALESDERLSHARPLPRPRPTRSATRRVRGRSAPALESEANALVPTQAPTRPPAARSRRATSAHKYREVARGGLRERAAACAGAAQMAPHVAAPTRRSARNLDRGRRVGGGRGTMPPRCQELGCARPSEHRPGPAADTLPHRAPACLRCRL